MVFKNEKILIGWREVVSLPEWKLDKVKAKVDTGARTSALHVEDLKEIGNKHIQFYICLDEETGKRQKITSKISRCGNVRSSTGEETYRYFVETKIKIGEQSYEIELSLVDRKSMRFPMLLGRTALKNNFIVDVSHSNLLRKKKGKIKK